MQLDETKIALEKFAKKIIRYSKSNLKKQKKNASGNLANSLKSNIHVSKNSVEFDILAADYADFVDKGVNGLKQKHGSNYSFRKGHPNKDMLTSLDKWAKKRGFAPRDKNGNLIPRPSLQFMLAKSIFNKGMKPSLFITKAYRDAMREFDQDVVTKFGLDTDKVINTILKDL